MSRIIEHSANAIVLVHNHPSGDPQPSAEDIRATKQLIEAGENIGIKVLDHIIIGDGVFCSFEQCVSSRETTRMGYGTQHLTVCRRAYV